MRRRRVAAAVVLAVAAVAALASAGPAAATNECRGLNPCVPVAGPWVVVPLMNKLPRPQAQYQLDCPRGFVVGGLDAEVNDRAIDLSFLGSSGSPIAPGISTSRSVVFVGWYAGTRSRAPSFRPHAGCIPASGGGGRVSTAAAAFPPPGRPVVRRVVTEPVVGHRRLVASCRTGERLVGWYASRGFALPSPPSPATVASLSAAARAAATHVVADARARSTGAVVQLGALCAGGT
jgi:hypothetical protein